MRARPLVGVAILLLVAAACVGEQPPISSEKSTTPATSPSASPSLTAELPADVALDAPATKALLRHLAGRLLIRSGNAGLMTTRPDGGQRRPLIGRGDGVLSVLDAAWAPDGRRVAWSQIASRDGLAVERLVVADATGGARAAADVGFSPFYLSWDPTSSRIGMLGEGGETLRFAVAEVAGGVTRVDDVATGVPFYFSWAPEGDGVLTNRNRGALERVGLDGSIVEVDPGLGSYQTPAWARDGEAFYVRHAAGSAQDLLARSPAGGEGRVLAVADGVVFFVAAPDGSRLAFHARGPEELDFYDRSLPDQATDLGVSVVDTRSGEVTRWSQAPAIAWFWSPDSTRLAILEPVYRADDPILFRWHVVGGGVDYATEPFGAPLRDLQTVVPFFTQYAQSGTMWAPDSSAFAYAIDTVQGPRVVVRPDRPDARGLVVARGDLPFWSV